MRALGCVVVLVAGCSSQRSTAPAPPAASASAAPVVVAVEEAGAPEPDPEPERGVDQILPVLGVESSACPTSMGAEARIRCFFDKRYAPDTKAASVAHELWVKWKVIAGVEPAHTIDGGYRGMIKIEPAVPIHADRKHLEWIAGAMRDFDQFFDELARYGADAGIVSASKRYRVKPITLRFMRSVNGRSPSAYASDWTVAWNLNGSLHTSADAVRETLFHELFHLNDYTHLSPEGSPWSLPVLGGIYKDIVRQCGATTACLGPFTPNGTMVRGGTYYSFQPGNDVREYAAELALRYYRDQRARLRRLTPEEKPFKCTGQERNRRAWELMRDEFFSGIDAVPACP
ncbi:MAG: hypothetical protein KIT84_17485 [Labilithrix sp.]|nr:hypothetical protein [Labilithrix sp.]MCW5812825.1 hypothetical protein [Labilithrix sp.]